MDKVYHLSCFSCSICRKELQTGEQLFLVQVRVCVCVRACVSLCLTHPLPHLVQGERFLCEKCYQMSIQTATATNSSATTPMTLPTATTNMPKSEALKFGEHTH